MINRENEQMKPSATPTPQPPPSAVSKAEKAREYAKVSVPKPRVRKPLEVGSDVPEMGSGFERLEIEEPPDALAALEAQHALHQQKAAAIRAELGL